jgi:hypothetical protein
MKHSHVAKQRVGYRILKRDNQLVAVKLATLSNVLRGPTQLRNIFLKHKPGNIKSRLLVPGRVASFSGGSRQTQSLTCLG